MSADVCKQVRPCYKKTRAALLTAVFFILCIAAPEVRAGNESTVAKSFETVVAKFRLFFKANRKAIAKEHFPDSPTKVIAWIEEYECKGIEYDIRRTDSLVSPYIGYVTLQVITRTNKSCGRLRVAGERWGWDNVKQAIERANDKSCYHFYPSDNNPMLDVVQFQFAYQDGKWVFQRVVRPVYRTPERLISSMLGKRFEPNLPITESDALKITDQWLYLIK